MTMGADKTITMRQRKDKIASCKHYKSGKNADNISELLIHSMQI